MQLSQLKGSEQLYLISKVQMPLGSMIDSKVDSTNGKGKHDCKGIDMFIGSLQEIRKIQIRANDTGWPQYTHLNRVTDSTLLR